MNVRIAWLKTGAVITVSTGLVFAGAVISPGLSSLMSATVDFVFGPMDGAQTVGGDSARLLMAICGGLLVGMGALLWVVITDVLPIYPMLARKLIIVGIGTWFVVDSSMSAAAGAPMNIVLNVGFLLIFVLPALGIRPSAQSRA